MHSKDARHKVSLPPVHHHATCARSRARGTFPLITVEKGCALAQSSWITQCIGISVFSQIHRRTFLPPSPSRGLRATAPSVSQKGKDISLLGEWALRFGDEEYHVSLNMRWYLVLTYIDRPLIFFSLVTSKGFWLLLLLLLFCFGFKPLPGNSILYLFAWIDIAHLILFTCLSFLITWLQKL